MPGRLGLAVCIVAIAAVATTGALGVSGDDKITTIAGTGKAGFSGDGGPATAARLHLPWWVAVDAKRNLYIADWENHRVRKVTAGGKITTIAGTGTAGYSGDGGPATRAKLNNPWSVAVDGDGNVYITEHNGNRVRKVSSGGVITTFAGTGVPGSSGDGGPATSATLSLPYGVVVDRSGNVYIAEHTGMRVRKVDRRGTITTFAGSGAKGFSGDGGPATSALLNGPMGLAVDRKGNVYIADNGNGRVRRVSPGGTIQTIAGTGKRGVYKDGMRATSAPLAQVVAVAVDLRGTVYISALGVIFVVSPRGRITRFAGNGSYTERLGDGGPARSAELNGPDGVAVDAKGNVYIADRAHHRVRRVAKR